MKKTETDRSANGFGKMLTVSPNPHIKSEEKTSSLMLCVITALLPAAVWGVYQFGLRALIVILALLFVGASALADSIEVRLNTATKAFQKASSSARSVKVPKGLRVKLEACDNHTDDDGNGVNLAS